MSGLSDLLRLRDHCQPCEHAPHGAVHVDFKEGHVVIDDAGFDSWCPGGREIVLAEVQWCDTHAVLATEPHEPECKLIDWAPTVYVEVTDDE